jgi:hypothetical protein
MLRPTRWEEGRMTTVEDNKALDLRFVNEVLNAHDLDVLPDLVAEDFVEQNPPPG